MPQQLSNTDSLKQEQFKDEIIPHLDAAYNFALRLTTNVMEAEDLLQESIVKAYRFFNNYERGTNARAWLYRIIKNSYINNYRRRSKQPDSVDYNEVSSFYEMIRAERSDTTDLEEKIYRTLMDDEVNQALKELPEKFRICIWLCDVEGFTYEEISNMLDIPIGTVRSRLHRGRNLLKKWLLDYAVGRGYEAVN